MRRPRRRHRATKIATRVLIGLESGKERTLEIDKPVRIGANWRCAFRLLGPGEEALKDRAWGVDAVQALQGAMLKIRSLVGNLGERHRWTGSKDEPGFPMLLPLHFGLRFARRLERLVDREVAAETARTKRLFDEKERRSRRAATGVKTGRTTTRRGRRDR